MPLPVAEPAQPVGEQCDHREQRQQQGDDEFLLLVQDAQSERHPQAPQRRTASRVTFRHIGASSFSA
jgi:hypothetical protein